MSTREITAKRADDRPQHLDATGAPPLVTFGGARHYHKPKELPFLAKHRATTTLLYGGLTEAHEELIGGHLKHLGYNAQRLPSTDTESFQTGKEYCNRGQCNPTYFTVGNLIRYLKKLAAETSVEEVENNYVFFTAGSCGPCRFGMYESEYRKAVIDAGFPNFRISIMQQAGGLDQDTAAGDEPGLDINKDFVVGLLKSVLVGDAINQMWFKITPYEIEQGATQRAKDEATAIVRRALEEGGSTWLALRRAKACFDAVECDFTRVKPIVKVTGEFWASITESEGNYHLKRWLMEEGAEVTQEPLTGWIEHLLYSREIGHAERRGIVEEGGGFKALAAPWIRESKLMALRHTLNGIYNVYRAALDFKPDDTVSNRTLADLADGYYNKRMGGGEAYMEVGNLIHSAKKGKIHMMASVKPFGCMPSTASDGVQSRVMNDYPQVIFLAVETSGDSEVNFKSRVQMKLFEAKQKAKEEAARIIEERGIDVDAVKRFVDHNPQYRRGSFVFDKKHTGTGISFLVEMHRRMSSRRGKLRHVAARALSSARSAAQR